MAPRQRSIRVSKSMSDDEQDDHSGHALLHHIDVPTNRVELLSKIPQKNGDTTKSLSHDVDRAIEIHDCFNLLALPFLVASCLINYDLQKIFLGYEESFVGDLYHYILISCNIYFFIDLLWVLLVPKCVKSPSTIVMHHLGAMVYIHFPVLWPEYRCYTLGVLAVEINTWFLILRRVAFKRKDIFTNTHLTKLINGIFYFTWIFIRLYVYPALLRTYFIMAYRDYLLNGLAWHNEYFALIVHSFLCVLNLKWSYDLFLPFFGKERNHPTKISNGL